MRLEPAVPEAVLAAMRAPLLAAGSQPAEPPLTLPLGLMLDLAGEATRARLFVVQAAGGEELCLRPDFTVGIARTHLRSGDRDGLYSYDGQAYRAAPDGAEPEAFVQLGLERLSNGGRDHLADETEIVDLAWRAAAAGGREDLTLRLGDVALFGAFLQALGAPEALSARLMRLAGRPRLLQAELDRDNQAGSGGALAARLSGLSEAEAGALLEEVWSLAGIEPVGGRGAGEIAARLVRRADAARAPSLSVEQAEAVRAFLGVEASPEVAFADIRALAGRNAPGLDAAVSAWERRLASLRSVIPANRMGFATALGHAFDYYDGLTFEVLSGALGSARPVASGGRYDGLMSRLGGEAGLTAVGGMVRPWRAWSGGQS
jgi:ATP phosphoribosyltransferase regulatory subunit